MSARAAWRLESLGFTQVYRYVPGKQDWFASGLPRAGQGAREPSAGDIARRDIPSCRLTERIGIVRERVEAAGWDRCVVVNEARVVLGLLRGEALHAAPETTAEQVMACGPRTFRPNVPLAELARFLQQHGRKHALVTDSDGVLLGIVDRSDAERRASGYQQENADHTYPTGMA